MLIARKVVGILGQEYIEILYFSLNFAVNLKLTPKIKLIN